MGETKVDVLAVMDDAFAELRALDGHGSGSLSVAADRLDQARDAVAELIEADREYDAALVAEGEVEEDDELYCNALRRSQWTKDRRAAALARIGAA